MRKLTCCALTAPRICCKMGSGSEESCAERAHASPLRFLFRACFPFQPPYRKGPPAHSRGRFLLYVFVPPKEERVRPASPFSEGKTQCGRHIARKKAKNGADIFKKSSVFSECADFCRKKGNFSKKKRKIKNIYEKRLQSCAVYGMITRKKGIFSCFLSEKHRQG